MPTRFAFTVPVLLLALSASPVRAASFQGVGRLPGGGLFYSQAQDVAPGPMVVGGSTLSDNTNAPFLFTPAGGIVEVGPFGENMYLKAANGISADGGVIVGQVSTDFIQSLRPFVWTPAHGPIVLSGFPGNTGAAAALAVSADGRTVVGYSDLNISLTNAKAEAFRWSARDGMARLGDFPGGYFYSSATAVSGDGSVIVGSSSGALGLQAFRWTRLGGLAGLGWLTEVEFRNSEAFGVSEDGSTVVGASNSPSGREAFVWTAASGMTGLGDFPGPWGGFSSEAHAASGDGAIIVGWGSTQNGTEAFIWSAASGMRLLADVLINDYGLDLAGWTLASADAITADGLTIAGDGINPSGQIEGWVATLDPPVARGVRP